MCRSRQELSKKAAIKHFCVDTAEIASPRTSPLKFGLPVSCLPRTAPLGQMNSHGNERPGETQRVGPGVLHWSLAAELPSNVEGSVLG